MTPSPILKVLSSMRKNGVACLLMGGQACVVYGAAEFSRDIDLAVSSEPDNLIRLAAALEDLKAEVIAVPPFERQFLDAGLAVHFRCQHPEAVSLRVDVMSKMRGVEKFRSLWERRTTIGDIDLLSLPDLVKAKKTQRDKDWPMVARLVEANYFLNREHPTPQQVAFWLSEMRAPDLLMEVVARFPAEAVSVSSHRPLLAIADTERLRSALLEEEQRERDLDRQYWLPLRQQLERLRHERHR